MPSFDIVIESNRVELRNGADHCNKEIATRFELKAASAAVDLAAPSPKARALTLFGDSRCRLDPVRDLLLAGLASRGVDFRFLDVSAAREKASGDCPRGPVAVRSGIDASSAKTIVAAVKASRLKLYAGTQGENRGIRGAQRDGLQILIALPRRKHTEWPLTLQLRRA